MQNTHDRERVTFEQYVAELQGFLTREFGIRAGADDIRLARQYHAKGRSPQFCAWALARLNGLSKGP